MLGQICTKVVRLIYRQTDRQKHTFVSLAVFHAYLSKQPFMCLSKYSDQQTGRQIDRLTSNRPTG